ncbi:DUF1127 domain-containing protein [uncultured Cohaesibacter sp.]|uniref:DUF1127 domain-containing protein n=1 Tax=uncultured Cohaesibacter sp. TaxID=1002546 RepID=UPI00292CCEA2|nr:DUF1127 domain-containing protein [uncultured Cohaesibacter sp.]
MLTVLMNSVLTFAAHSMRRVVSGLATIARNRAALSQLSELDEHTLADIGLTKGDIVVAASQPLYRNPMLIDPFEARNRIHARELEVLARWHRPSEPPHKVAETLRITETLKACCSDQKVETASSGCA